MPNKGEYLVLGLGLIIDSSWRGGRGHVDIMVGATASVSFQFCFRSSYCCTKLHYNYSMFFMKQSHSLLCLSLPCALLLGGCSGLPAKNPAVPMEGQGRPMSFTTEILRKHREKVLQGVWAGKPYASLLALMGPPKVVMEIPGRPHYSSARVYGVMDDDSQCIDAFTVVMQANDLIVANYFCR
jgi:hypothetical protein